MKNATARLHEIEKPASVNFGRATPILSVPWYEDMLVGVDGDGMWTPDDGHDHSQACLNCHGKSSTHGAAARYCPWCGAALDASQSYAQPDADTFALAEALSKD